MPEKSTAGKVVPGCEDWESLHPLGRFSFQERWPARPPLCPGSQSGRPLITGQPISPPPSQGLSPQRRTMCADLGGKDKGGSQWRPVLPVVTRQHQVDTGRTPTLGWVQRPMLRQSLPIHSSYLSCPQPSAHFDMAAAPAVPTPPFPPQHVHRKDTCSAFVPHTAWVTCPHTASPQEKTDG